MYAYLKRILFFLLLFVSLQLSVQAQNDKIAITDQDYQNSRVEMADQFRAEGKIYVVVTVISLILIGIFVYLFSLDRKIEKLEKIVDSK